MRGTRIRSRRHVCPLRFIPAHAGNTAGRSSFVSCGAVHPRACGEHVQVCRFYEPGDGSSPRMRGTQIPLFAEIRLCRFIPAHAGNTTDQAVTAALERGSSPRMRGTPPVQEAAPQQLRFIPAHAGNTAPARPVRARNPVHPRACGEHTKARLISGPQRGSSPRMRGTQHPGGYRRRRQRFIPAHEGNTLEAQRPPRQMPVHPRACGEHAVGWCALMNATGSSPRMRGTQLEQIAGFRGARFIPAHAGNTERLSVARGGSAVHPRACGEHVLDCETPPEGDGSSPRMRGTLAHQKVGGDAVRFIPAHAGNTR